MTNSIAESVQVLVAGMREVESAFDVKHWRITGGLRAFQVDLLCKNNYVVGAVTFGSDGFSMYIEEICPDWCPVFSTVTEAIAWVKAKRQI